MRKSHRREECIVHNGQVVYVPVDSHVGRKRLESTFVFLYIDLRALNELENLFEAWKDWEPIIGRLVNLEFFLVLFWAMPGLDITNKWSLIK